MWLVIDVFSHSNRSANGMYLVDLTGSVDIRTDDIATFLEVSEYEVRILRVFNVMKPNDEAIGLPTIFVNEEEMMFV